MATHIVLTQKKSGIGRPENQRQTLRGLGLKGPHSTAVLQDTPAIRGMILKVHHLVDVKVFEGAVPLSGKRHTKAKKS
jgi:large subunit ribosomal protein L30